MHTDEEQRQILEAAKDAANNVMSVGKEAVVCPHCFLILTMALIAKCLNDPEQESPMDLDYVIYAMLQDYYDIEDARNIKTTSKMH